MPSDLEGTQSQADEAPVRSPVRSRAAKACRRCHEKRVKCDASVRGTPCTRCQQRREPDCVLIQSRRGLYQRTSTKRRQPRVRSAQTSAPTDSSTVGTQDSVNKAPACSTTISTPEPLRTLAEEPAADSGEAAIDLAGQRPHDQVSSPSQNGHPYREISWATTFDHLLEHHHNAGSVLDKRSITYIGEAFPLGLVLKDLRGGSGRPPLHHPAPPCASEHVADSPRLSHPPGMRPAEIAFLEAKEAFTAPPQDTLNALVDCFFERVFPLYPIVDPHELLSQHKARRIPWMLLHALCLASATYCPIRVLHCAGYTSRPQARLLFYDKTKALFDIGYEGNKIVAVQACILMSFWGGGGPSNYWNFYTWICTGVTIAETLGFHRSMARACIEQRDRSLIKRLWWVLLIRDANCASLVGRPFRINLDHCDVEPLMDEDFLYDAASSSSSPGFLNSLLMQCSGLYQIQAARLSLILRHIIATRFYPKKLSSTAGVKVMLTDWRISLPAELDWTDCGSNRPSTFMSTLCIMYNHNIILANVKSQTESLLDDPARMFLHSPFEEDSATAAAQQIAACSCSVVTASDGLLPPQELFHGLFIASVVFYMQTKSHNRATAMLGTSGLTNCKMALHASRETWDASPWISQLFDRILRTTTTNHGLATGQHGVDMAVDSTNATTLDVNGYSLPAYDEWPSHLFLGNMYGVATDDPASMSGASAIEMPWA